MYWEKKKKKKINNDRILKKRFVEEEEPFYTLMIDNKTKTTIEKNIKHIINIDNNIIINKNSKDRRKNVE